MQHALRRPWSAARRAASLAALLAAAPCVVHGQAAGLRVSVRDTTTRVTDPGAAMSLVYVLVNDGRAPAAAGVRLELPARWRAVTGAGRLELAGSASDLQILSFAVPANAPAGVYRVAIVVTPAAGGVTSTAGIAVHVRERRRLSVAVQQAPEFVMAGERFEATFVATNLGNAVSTVHTLASAGDGVRVAADSLSVVVAPGESRVVRVQGRADIGSLGDGGERFLQLRVQPERARADSEAVSVTTRLTVLPAQSQAGDLAARVPTALTLRSGRAGMGRHEMLRGFEWSGGGPLGADDDARVNFFARWTSGGFSPFGERNQYRFDIRHSGLELRLGDHFYALSPLTAPGRTATGVGVRLDRGMWSAGGFANRGRWPALAQDERALFARVNRGGSSLALHYLALDGLATGRATSARVRLDGGTLARIDAEYGAALDARGADAWRMSASGRHAALAYDFRFVRADSAYPGHAGGSQERSGLVTLQPSELFRLTAQYNAGRAVPGPLRRNTETNTETRVLTAGLGRLVDLSYRTGDWSGRTLVMHFDASEHAVDLRLAGGRGRARFTALVSAGEFDEATVGTPSPFRIYQLDATHPLPWRTELTGNVRRTTGRSLRSWFSDATTSVGITADIARGMATSARLSASVEETSAAWPGRTARLDVEAVHKLPRGHEVSLQLRTPGRSMIGGTDLMQSTAQVEYRIPLAAPVGTRRDVGRLIVQVTDARTGRGVPGVVLRLGGKAVVTDAHGRTVAIVLPSGRHAVRIDRTGTELGLVSETPLPPTVRVEGGRTARLNVSLLPSARLIGHVRRHAVAGSVLADEDTRTLVDSGGVPGIVVTLSRGTEVLHRTSGPDGSFSFGDLRPGRWSVRLAGAVPAEHELERPATDVDLASGSTQEETWRVIPRLRRVQMTTEGELVAEPPVKPVPRATPSPPAAPPRVPGRVRPRVPTP